MSHRAFAIICVFALFSGALRADTVELKENGLKLEGKVHRVTDEYIILLLPDDSAEGWVRIPRDKIKSIEYDIKTRLSSLEKDDYAGQYKVGVWAMEKGKYADAIKLFEQLKGKEGVGTDLLKLLGKAYQERQQLDKALASYSDYLKAHPDDAEVTATIKSLGEKISPQSAEDKTAKPKVVEGLEADGTWVAENWGNPGRVQITDDNGNKVVVAQSQGGAKDKSAFSRTGQPLNLSDSSEMVFRVFNTGKIPLKLAVAFYNSQAEYYETKLFSAAPETWTPIDIKVAGKVFKSDRNQFKDFNQELGGRERVNRITFLIYGQKESAMYLDGIYFK